MNNHKALSRVYKTLPFLQWRNRITSSNLRSDFLAGLTGAMIVLPQGVAYALIAGLPPEYGLYTAIVVPIIAGLFGSSWHMVSGPAAAISIVVFGIVSGITPPDSTTFIPLVLTLTFLVGIFQLALGLLKVGALVNFISHTVVIGFTAGAAVLIGTSQLKHMLGLDISSGLSFYHTLIELINALPETNLAALGIGAFSLITAVLFKKFLPRLPNMLIAMTAGTLLCGAIDGASYGVHLIGSLPGDLPPFSFFELQFGQISVLGTGALAVAIIALIEAASIARAISLRSRQRIDGNQEFMGQGLSNLVGSLFSCFVGSGSFTRSGVNYDSGAKTPLAALFAAVILALIILLAPQMTAYLPMPVMGGIVILIAWNLIDTQHVRQIIRVSKEEATILLVTFSATLLFPLEFAIYAGVILSIALFLRHSAKPRLTAVVPIPYRAGTPLRSAYRHQLPECEQVKILRLDGELFFGSITHIQNEIRQVCDHQSFKHLLLVGSGVNYIDLAGAEMLAEESKRLKAAGITLHLSNFKGGALKTLKHGNFEHSIGKHHIHVSHHVALMKIQPELQCNCPCSEYNEQSRCIIYQAYGHRANDSCAEDLVYTPGTSISSGLMP